MRYQPQEIVIYDDNSTDNTSEIANLFTPHLPQLKIIKGTKEPTEGWLGKAHACHTMGVKAKGKYLLFLDADVRLFGEIEPTYLHYAHKRELSLLSLFPFQITETKEERNTVPVMNWILLSLLPLPLIRYSSFSSLAAANGQFMLFRKDHYLKTLPHSRFRGSHAEDIEISRYFKKQRLRTETLCSNKTVACRMYHSSGEAVEGFSKNVLHFFGNSATAAILFSLTTTLSPLYILIINGFTLFALYIATALTIRIATSATSGKPWYDSILNSLQLQINFVTMIVRAINNRKKQQLIWKGRNIY
jgi:glycosyltransferase involved in cell wall biosynthesis